MTITKRRDGSALEIALVGRLDSLAAPELEREFNESLGGVTALTLDFAELTYISSAGLRALFIALQTMKEQGTMKLVHVREFIKEIFEVTGFIEILTIE